MTDNSEKGFKLYVIGKNSTIKKLHLNDEINWKK